MPQNRHTIIFIVMSYPFVLRPLFEASLICVIGVFLQSSIAW